MTALTFEDGTPIRCEWTPDGPDKSLIYACGKPATYDDAANDAWYCEEHIPVDDPCVHCDHGYALHAFFPDGEPAALCAGVYKPRDTALIDHTCECEGYAPQEDTEGGI